MPLEDELPRFGPVMKPPYRKKTCTEPTPACCVPGQLKVNLASGKGQFSRMTHVVYFSTLGGNQNAFQQFLNHDLYCIEVWVET